MVSLCYLLAQMVSGENSVASHIFVHLNVICLPPLSAFNIFFLCLFLSSSNIICVRVCGARAHVQTCLVFLDLWFWRLFTYSYNTQLTILKRRVHWFLVWYFVFSIHWYWYSQCCTNYHLSSTGFENSWLLSFICSFLFLFCISSYVYYIKEFYFVIHLLDFLLFFSSSFFLLYVSGFSNFYSPIFKFSDSFLDYVSSAGKYVEDILYLCYCLLFLA